MGGATCAERAAMVQLRFAPPHKLTKLVIATDSLDAISPGILCREFLAGHGKQKFLMEIARLISSGCIFATIATFEMMACLRPSRPAQVVGSIMRLQSSKQNCIHIHILYSSNVKRVGSLGRVL